MNREKYWIAAAFGVLPVIYTALKLSPYIKDGFTGIITGFSLAMGNPLHIEFCENSLRTVILFLCVYVLGICIFLSSGKIYRRGEEYGSARWGVASTVNRRYEKRRSMDNKILTQNVSIGMEGRQHRRNVNVLVCGGSGAGKTRFYCKPNIMQANTSFVILDPKGEILRDAGNLLKAEGYNIRVLDLINMEKSHCYNPFVYLRDDNDVQKLVTNLFKSTTPKGSKSSDPFGIPQPPCCC